MLTPKQNMLEVIKGGNPDRFVNQYEAVQLLFHPFMFTNPLLQPGQENMFLSTNRLVCWTIFFATSK